MPGPDFSLVFPPDPAWVRSAREAVRTLLVAAHRPDLTDTALLLTSEAVTNAVNACQRDGCSTPLTLFAEWTDSVGALRVLVRDEAPGLPVPRAPDDGEESGRGIGLIEACAAGWGVCHHGPGPGKAIWFELNRLATKVPCFSIRRQPARRREFIVPPETHRLQIWRELAGCAVPADRSSCVASKRTSSVALKCGSAWQWHSKYVSMGSIQPCTGGMDSSGKCRMMGDSYSASLAPWLVEAIGHGAYGGQYCFVICGGISRAGDGHGYVNIGAIGFGGRGTAGGFSTAPSGEQSWLSMQGCTSLGHGACGGVGTRSNPDLDVMSPDQAATGDYWYGATYAPGVGWFAGINIAIPLW